MLELRELYLVTSNLHKLQEYQRMLERVNIEVKQVEVRAEELSLEFGGFVLNSIKKAEAGYQLVKAPVIADDSGLVIPALGNILGVTSSRFLSGLPQAQKNLAITRLLRDLPQNYRRAYFHCSLTLMLERDRFICFSRRVYGRIAQEPKGENGFGYDPIFIPDGYNVTFGQMSPQLKDKLSHRAKAIGELINYIQGVNLELRDYGTVGQVISLEEEA